MGETFSKYMTRWKGKTSMMVNRPNEKDQINMMVNRPNEKDQINMIVKNLLSTYNSRLLSSPISLFGELLN